MPDRLAAMQALAQAQPANPLARFGYANELLKAQRLDEATAELAAYLALYDDEGNGWLRYADALQALGRATEAHAALARGRAAAERFGHATLVQEFELRLEEWDG